jgi:quercetin dioxygenase-like cupin family protein
MLGGLMAEAQTGPEHGEGHPSTAMDAAEMAKSRIFHFDQMPVNHYANGGWGRQVMHGTLPTGEFVELHETMLPPGQMPHPPHRHRNTEFVLIREGKLKFYDNGKPEPCGPGDIVYTASNQLHGMKNVGTTPALYFVVSVSHGQM